MYFPYGSRASSLAWGDRRKVLFRVGGGIVDRRLCLLLAIVLQLVAPISGALLPCQTEVSFRGTLEPTQWRWKCGQVRIAGLKASSRACTRPTVTSLLMHSHSPSAQAHFVPELTVWGIASESKFVHQFFMTYSLCVAARFSAWIVSGFSRRPIFHGISNRSLAARHGDAVCVPPGSSVVGSFLDVFGQLLAVCEGDVAWCRAIPLVPLDDLRLDILLHVHTGVSDTRIDVDGCLLRRPLKFVASTTVTEYFPYGSRASSLAWGDRA